MRTLILDGEKVRSTDDYAVVASAHAEGKTFWMELDERCELGTAFLADTLKLHPLAIEDVWNDVGIPKIEDFDDYLQVVIHGIREDDRASKDVPLALAELDLVIGKTWLVSHAHDERACAITPTQIEVQRNPKLLKKGPAWVAHAILDRLVDEYLPVIERFDERIETIETTILEGNVHSDREVIPHIIRIKRSLQMLRRTTIYQREILLRLARSEFDEIPRDLGPFYRDIYDHFARVTELVDSYRELVTGLLEAQFSMQSNRMNLIMKRLTITSTLMLPLSLIAGIYGMNFKHMPELEWLYGYPFALCLMGAIGVGILLFFRSKHWL
ncbi:MAG: Magnesium and cobalt transport protein CorA [Labilithrix sp.]|nr:Magnesium and cobalt transport protein CorA [Labilithrix sp.]